MYKQIAAFLIGLFIAIFNMTEYFVDSRSFWEVKNYGSIPTSGFIYTVIGLMLVFFSFRELKEEYENQRQILNHKRKRKSGQNKAQ
jgi:hypothetical protein